MTRCAAVSILAAVALVACGSGDESSGFETSVCDAGDCDNVDLDKLQETLQICRYEVDLAGMPFETAFPVIVMKPFRDDKFCGWEGMTLQYAVQMDGECPSAKDFRSQLSITAGGPVAARLVGSAKAISMTPEDMRAANQVRCRSVSTALDNDANRSRAVETGLLDRTEAFVVEGDVLQEFGLDWALAELRGLNGLPITTAFYSVDKVTVHWRATEYPFAVDICAETRQRLIENGAMNETATCRESQ